MTPKEKAKELVDKYFEYMSYINPWDKAKQCSLIAVEEMLNELPDGYMGNFAEERKQYWKDVKIEIENL